MSSFCRSFTEEQGVLVYGISISSFLDGLKLWGKAGIELGEFSLPNAFDQGIDRCTEPSTHQPSNERGDTMPRPANAEKVFTIPVQTITDATIWSERLKEKGFVAQGFRYNGEGTLVSAMCTKDGKSQTITPEIYDVITGS